MHEKIFNYLQQHKFMYAFVSYKITYQNENYQNRNL